MLQKTNKMFPYLSRVRFKLSIIFCCLFLLYIRYSSGQSSQNINVCKFFNILVQCKNKQLGFLYCDKHLIWTEKKKLKNVKYFSSNVEIFVPFKVFINEVDNDPASQALEIVLNYIKKNPSLGLSVQLMPIEGNRTDSKKFLENSKFFFLVLLWVFFK